MPERGVTLMRPSSPRSPQKPPPWRVLGEAQAIKRRYRALIQDPIGEPCSPDGLSRSERDILSQIAAGASNSEIAAARGTSVNTIAKQTSSVLRKLRVSSRRGLVALWHATASEPSLDLAQVSLTDCERRVVVLAMTGTSNKLIAAELGLAIGTVATLLSRARRKIARGARAA